MFINTGLFVSKKQLFHGCGNVSLGAICYLVIVLFMFIKYKDTFEFCSEWHQVENDCSKALELDNSLTKVRVKISVVRFVVQNVPT